MDITILLALQGFRNGAGAILTDFFFKMTSFGEKTICLLVPALIYWCFSKEMGTYLMMGWSWNRVLNGTMKITACIYRPWVRDARIIPNKEALVTATGFSFPSGHSMNAASIFGGGAIRQDLPRFLRVILAVIMALVAFSRPFLGVHTPQDILIGSALGLTVMLITLYIMRWISEHPERDWIVACIGILIAVIVCVYAALKAYPEDYDAAGKLIVDGTKLAKDTFKSSGGVAAFFCGWFLERRFVRFSTEVSAQQKATRAVAGLFFFYVVDLILLPLINEVIPGTAGTVITNFIQMFYFVFLFPCCIKIFEK